MQKKEASPCILDPLAKEKTLFIIFTSTPGCYLLPGSARSFVLAHDRCFGAILAKVLIQIFL